MEQQTFFDRDGAQPLAARLRPRTLDEFVGQRHLLGPGKVLTRLIESDHLSSMIFWGPPGVGKTTLARIIAGHTKASFIDFSAVTSGIREIRAVMQKAGKTGVTVSAHWSLWTKFTVSTRPSRTRFCPLWKRAASF